MMKRAIAVVLAACIAPLEQGCSSVSCQDVQDPACVGGADGSADVMADGTSDAIGDVAPDADSGTGKDVGSDAPSEIGASDAACDSSSGIMLRGPVRRPVPAGALRLVRERLRPANVRQGDGYVH